MYFCLEEHSIKYVNNWVIILFLCPSKFAILYLCQIKRKRTKFALSYEVWSSLQSQQESSKCSIWLQSQKPQTNLGSFPRQIIQHYNNPSLYLNQWCWRRKTISKKKKCKREKWLSEEALQIAEESREVKGKRRKGKIYSTECRVPEESNEK